MALSTKAKSLANAALRPLGAKIDSLTAEAEEHARLDAHAARFGFEAPLYALSPGMDAFDPAPLIEAAAAHREALARLRDPARNETGYAPGNDFFESPDAEILYLMIRRLAPRRIVEVGCGHSTRVARQAILDAARDGAPETHLTAIDPQPRADIEPYADRFERARLEAIPLALFEALGPGDILFIDSSHELRAGNDVAHLFCRILPRLAPGVAIHLHDVFLPFEYPERFFREHPSWGEQYALHALLSGGGHEILWPGFFLQKTCPGLNVSLPFLEDGAAQSFWFRRKEETLR